MATRESVFTQVSTSITLTPLQRQARVYKEPDQFRQNVNYKDRQSTFNPLSHNEEVKTQAVNPLKQKTVSRRLGGNNIFDDGDCFLMSPTKKKNNMNEFQTSTDLFNGDTEAKAAKPVAKKVHNAKTQALVGNCPMVHNA